MELVCEKYQEKMDSATAVCRHLHDYCQFRSSCLIFFLGQERKRQKKGPQGPAEEK